MIKYCFSKKLAEKVIINLMLEKTKSEVKELVDWTASKIIYIYIYIIKIMGLNK